MKLILATVILLTTLLVSSKANAQFCDGAQIPAMGEEDPASLKSVLASIMKLFSKDEAIPTVQGGTPSTNSYSTFVVNNCTAVAIGPHTLVSAAHCVRPQKYAPGDLKWAYKTFSVSPPNEPKYHINRSVTHPGYGGEIALDENDVVIHYVEETLPPPYVTTIYDPTNHANCSGLLSQGYGPAESSSPLTECPYYADVETINGNTILRGDCTDASLNNIGGDSGGPLYAFVDHDSNPGTPDQVQLAGISHGLWGPNPAWGSPYMAALHIYAFPKAAWFAANATPTPIGTTSNGVKLWGAFTSTIDEMESITGQDSTVGCSMLLEATVNPIKFAFCEAVSATTGRETSCTATALKDGKWSCDLLVKNNSANDWIINRVYIVDTLGNEGTIEPQTFLDSEAWNTLLCFSSTPVVDVTPPSLYPHTVTQQPKASDTVRCNITASDSSGIRNIGCEFYSSSYDGTSDKTLSCIGKNTNFCEFIVPSDAEVGDVWSVVQVFVEDEAGNVTKSRSGQSFTVDDGTNPPQQGFIQVNTDLLPAECNNKGTWAISSLGLWGTTNYGPIPVPDGFYQLQWFDTAYACLRPNPFLDGQTVAGPGTFIFALSPTNYTVRTTGTASVIIQQNGADCVGNPGCVGFGGWSFQAAGYEDEYTENGIGSNPLTGPIYTNRLIYGYFLDEPGYVTPTGQDFTGGGIDTVTANYVTKKDQLIIDVTPDSGPTWEITGFELSAPITGTGDDSVDLVPGIYNVIFNDNLMAYTQPSSVYNIEVIYGQATDPTAIGNYGTIRTTSTLNVTVLQNGADCGGDPGCQSFGPWRITPQGGPYTDWSYSPGATDTGTTLPVLTHNARQGRTYAIDFEDETNYTTPTPAPVTASGAQVNFTGNYQGI
jgi:hypothetical protein